MSRTLIQTMPRNHEEAILKPSIYEKFKAVIMKNLDLMKKEAGSECKESSLSQCALQTEDEEVKEEQGLTLHFYGLRPMPDHDKRLLLDRIDVKSVVTLQTSVKPSDTIKDLKRFLQTAFGIPLFYELLILFSHIEISKDDSAKLSDYHITDRSLLTLAVSSKSSLVKEVEQLLLPGKATRNRSNKACTKRPCKPCNVYKPCHEFSAECVKGFDPITLDASADTFRMPLCGHLMGKTSLLHYVEAQFRDKNTVCLTCPHHQHQQVEEKKEEKYPEHDDDNKNNNNNDKDAGDWRCEECDYPNGDSEHQCELCGAVRRWSCPRCTFSNSSSAQQCTVCECVNPAVVDTTTKDPLCRKFWDWTLVKKVLTSDKGESLISQATGSEKEQQELLNEYYSLRHQYSSIRQHQKKAPQKLETSLMNLEGKLLFEFEMSDEYQLEQVREMAQHHALAGRFAPPNTDELEDHRLADMMAKLELLAGRNAMQQRYALQRCPTCQTVHYRELVHEDKEKNGKDAQDAKDGEDDKKHRVQCAMCKDKAFCWRCGKDWGEKHYCDLSFRDELVNILATAKTKKIGSVDGIPSIRACPKCCQLIYHTDACKHMECQNCRQKFCFVCLSLCGPSGWTCGSYSAKCPVAPSQTLDNLPGTDFMVKRSFELFRTF